MLISLYLGRSGQYGPINKAVYLFSVYLLGMFASVHHDQMLDLVKRFQWLLLAFIVGLIFVNMVSTGYEQYVQYTLKVAMCPLLLFYFYRAEKVVDGRLDYLGHVSFGIFFIHAYVLPAIKIIYLKASGLSTFPEGDILSYGSLTVSVTLGCMLVIYLSQKITGRYSRMLLGA